MAIVHDSLTEFGGAERVLGELLEIFPQADVYTAFFRPEIVKQFFPNIVSRLRATAAQNTILTTRFSLFQCAAPALWRAFDFSRYDAVISNSTYALCNLVRVRDIPHIQYVQCPPKNLFGLEPPLRLQRLIPYTSLLAQWYTRAIRSSPYILTNSSHMQRLLHKICGVNSTIMYPPVRVPGVLPKRRKPHYFLCVSRLDSAKFLQIPIAACSRLGLPLKVVGATNDSRYERYLRQLAGPTIEFLGFRSDTEIDQLYEYAGALLFSSKSEDFGIVPVEAMAHGVPVIAYCGGGVKETVIPGQTGLFFYQHSAASLARVLGGFRPEAFEPKTLYKFASTFSEARFRKRMKNYVLHCVELAQLRRNTLLANDPS